MGEVTSMLASYIHPQLPFITKDLFEKALGITRKVSLAADFPGHDEHKTVNIATTDTLGKNDTTVHFRDVQLDPVGDHGLSHNTGI
ncbi:unnamed protein product [Caretta caretta]